MRTKRERDDREPAPAAERPYHHQGETHIERINPDEGGGHAYAPGYAEPAVHNPHRGEQKPYRLLVKGVHNNMLKAAGEIVMLYDDEVGPHHEAMPLPKPASKRASADKEC